MSKRKKTDVNLEEDDDDDDNTHSRDKSRQQQPPQKVYDFHKKTIEVYPARLLELNRQFVASISSQVSNEQYSVLVGNCLDYVRQYFNYEDDLLQYSPWLATRLKQSRSNIVKCLQETIDVYEALARHDFDRIVDKNHVERSSNDSVVNTIDTPAQSTASSFSFRPLTTSSSSSVLNFTNPVTTTATSESTTFNFTKSTTTSTAAMNETTSYTPFNFTQPTAANVSAPSTGFNFMKSTTAVAVNDSPPPPPLSTGFSFAKTTTTTTPSDPIPSTGFSFKMPTTSASPDKTTSTPPFAFSIPNTGFGTSTFTPPSFRNPASTEKSSTGLASSISFTPPPQFSFGSTPVPTGEQRGTTEDDEDEPSEPPEPEKVEHEADAKLTYRCRMGVKKGDKLIKRGPVQVILKEANDKHQLIIRSDDTLGRLYLNILWSKSVPINTNSTKDLTFVCKLNPGMPEISEGDVVVVLLRFDNETDRNDAYEKLNKERT